MTLTFKTLSAFAFALGTAERMTREDGAHWHATYIKATEEKQAEMRSEYCVAYMQGNNTTEVKGVKVHWTETKAIEVRDMVRERGTEEYDAWNRAQANFHYRVVNNSGRAEKAQEQKAKVKISAEARALLEQLDALYATYPEMREVCNAYISAKTAK